MAGGMWSVMDLAEMVMLLRSSRESVGHTKNSRSNFKPRYYPRFASLARHNRFHIPWFWFAAMRRVSVSGGV